MIKFGCYCHRSLAGPSRVFHYAIAEALQNYYTLCCSTSAAGISSHRDGLLQLLDILEIFDSSVQLPAIDRCCRFAGVLEADSEVGASSASRLLWLDLVVAVSDHLGAVRMARYKGR